MKPVTPSPALAKVVGAEPLARTEVVKRLWAYIKEHGLQDKTDRRRINADDTLRQVFGQDQVTMFEMTALVNKQLIT
jgi:chromatin remodeling complex protein RSC6